MHTAIHKINITLFKIKYVNQLLTGVEWHINLLLLICHFNEVKENRLLNAIS